MRFESLTAVPPIHTPDRHTLISVCLQAVTQREMAPTPNAAAGDAAKADTDKLKAFFDALSVRLAAVSTAQDAQL